MPKIYVEFSGLDKIGDRCKWIAGKIDDIKEDFQRTVRKLDWDVRYKSDINSTATKLARKLDGYSKALEAYHQFIDAAYAEYAKLDAYEKLDFDEYIIASESSGGAKDFIESLIEIIGYIGDGASFVDDILDNTDAEITGGILDYLVTLAKTVTGENEDSVSVYNSILGLTSASVKIIGNVFKWFGGEANASKELGIFGAFLSVYTNAVKAGDITENPAEHLLNSGGLISAIGKLTQKITTYGEDISKLSSEEKTQRNLVLTAIVSMATMATRLTGNIMQKTSDDGVYDIDDYGQTLLDTGVAGGASFVSGMTFGLVNVDATRAVEIFNENISDAVDLISQVGDATGAPTWAEAIAAVPGAVVVSIWSICEVFIDYGMEIGDNIMNVVNATSEVEAIQPSAAGSSGGGGR